MIPDKLRLPEGGVNWGALREERCVREKTVRVQRSKAKDASRKLKAQKGEGDGKPGGEKKRTRKVLDSTYLCRTVYFFSLLLFT